MARQKTTVYLDSEILTATKVLAAASQRTESNVVEEALRVYLGSNELADAKERLKSLMERVATRPKLDDDEAMALAVDEVRAVRRSTTSRRRA